MKIYHRQRDSRVNLPDNLIRALEWKYFKVTTNFAYALYLVQFTVFNYDIGVARTATFASIYRCLVRSVAKHVENVQIWTIFFAV